MRPEWLGRVSAPRQPSRALPETGMRGLFLTTLSLSGGFTKRSPTPLGVGDLLGTCSNWGIRTTKAPKRSVAGESSLG